ncbi:MAG: response regulator [Elusimicrobia bacterium]|nr:response regulator [Elusimicrobiota bacterium]
MSHKILIADDDYDNRAVLKEALEAAGLNVILATNGEEALRMALEEAPDLIFLDLSMPRLSGWEVAKRIRAVPRIARIPIFAFTAHALQGDEVKARAAGCDDYISKPCIPREVVKKVRALLGSGQEANIHGQDTDH